MAASKSFISSLRSFSTRKKKKKTPLWLPFAIVMGVIAVISGVVVYGVSLVNKVEDSIRPDDSTPTIEEEVKTAEEYKGDVVNILVCGIDYEEGRNYGGAAHCVHRLRSALHPCWTRRDAVQPLPDPAG